MKYILRIFILLSFIFLFSCGRNDSYTKKIIHIEPIRIQYFSKSSIIGQVVDQDLNVLPNTIVSFKDYNNKLQTTQTDENGIFKIKNKFLDENGQILTFNKSEYFTQYAYIEPSKNQLSVVSLVQQLKNEARKIYAKANNSEFFYNNTIEMDIPPHSIIDKNNNKYTGSFNLFCKSPFLKQNTQCYPDLGIPFSNIGINLDKKRTIVFPLFSTLIQIEDDAENLLFFGDSATVKIKKSNVPCLVHENYILWFFDSNTGKWIAQNEIHSTSNILKFNIIKSGYYIITNKTDIILSIEGQMLYSDHSPAENVYFEVIERQTGLLLGQYYSDNFGTIRFFKEENKDVSLIIPKCDKSNYEYLIGKNEKNIGELVLPDDFNNKFELSIESPVSHGFLIVEEKGYDFSTKLSVPVHDSIQNKIDLYSCNSSYISLYDVEGLPFVKNSTPILLYKGIQIEAKDFIPLKETSTYIYININNKEEEIFDINNYIYQEENATTIESVSSRSIAAIRFNESDSFCHFSYIKLLSKLDFDIMRTTHDDPLNFEIITSDEQYLIGHFFGTINYKGESKTIDGYFKILN